MLFNSFTFLAFFAIVFALFWLKSGWDYRKNLLLVASYVFYGAWSPPYVLILAASTSVDWLLARLIWRTAKPIQRRLLLYASLTCNLGLLAYFKYGTFLVKNFAELLAHVGVQYSPPSVDIVLPIGISFYTFASLSYTIDVYRGQVRGDWSFRDYALFVSFFPHLVAGPIVRAQALLPQIERPRNPSADQVGWGLILLTFGLFAKVVLADHLFAPIVDKVYADAAHCSMLDAWAAVFAFSGQIYYDFSGYSTCAIGLALCFGFAFPDNFRYPYAARGLSDFWRRWHISLSTWLRDYLYIPLGGNRHGGTSTTRNLMLTMLLGGVWHGASWMFVLWGGLHGTFLAIEAWWRRRSTVVASVSSDQHDVIVALLTFLLVSVSWIPFRAPDLGVAASIAAGLFRVGAEPILYAPEILLAITFMAATFCWHFALKDSSIESMFARALNPVRLAMLTGCLLGLYLVSGGSGRAFIYYQF